MSCVPPEPRIENMLTDHGADVSVLPPEIQAICWEALVSSFNHENVLHRSTFLDSPHLIDFLRAFWVREEQCYTYSYLPDLTDDTTQEFLFLARASNRAAFDELAGLYMTRDRIQGFWDGIRQRVGEGTA